MINDGAFKAAPSDFLDPPTEITPEIRYKSSKNRHELY